MLNNLTVLKYFNCDKLYQSSLSIKFLMVYYSVGNFKKLRNEPLPIYFVQIDGEGLILIILATASMLSINTIEKIMFNKKTCYAFDERASIANCSYYNLAEARLNMFL